MAKRKGRSSERVRSRSVSATAPTRRGKLPTSRWPSGAIVHRQDGFLTGIVRGYPPRLPGKQRPSGPTRRSSRRPEKKAGSSFDVFSIKEVLDVGPSVVHDPAVVCAKRKERREVLHALNVAGRRGVGAGKRRRVSRDSKVRC